MYVKVEKVIKDVVFVAEGHDLLEKFKDDPDCRFFHDFGRWHIVINDEKVYDVLADTVEEAIKNFMNKNPRCDFIVVSPHDDDPWEPCGEEEYHEVEVDKDGMIIDHDIVLDGYIDMNKSQFQYYHQAVYIVKNGVVVDEKQY